MDTSFYLDLFKKTADKLDKELFNKKQLEVEVVTYGDSVVLKLFKKSWVTPFQDPLTAESRIFFSIWISDSAIKQQKIFYNIHALKLRQLKGYTIQSRKFADTFRDIFKHFEYKWENVSVKFGPLTLMEGWKKVDFDNLKGGILELANNFLEIEHLVDNTLTKFRE